MISKTRVALACLLCALASHAMASSQASASISNLKFQLIDLNPMDGESASVTYGGGSTSLSLSGYDGSTGDSDSASRTRSGYMSFSRVYEVSLDNVTGSASIGNGELNLSGSANGLSTSFSAGASSYASQLQLSANSLLIITADASVAAAALNAPDCASNYYRCGASESASASATMSLNYSYYTSTGSTTVNYSDSVTSSAQSVGAQDVTDYYGYNWYYCYYYGYYCSSNPTHYDKTEQSVSSSRTFSAVFMNTSSSTQSAYFSLGTSINGSATSAGLQSAGGVANVTPVPEAGTTALALVGAAVVGGVATRRRRQAA
jgi:hypothetical protein